MRLINVAALDSQSQFWLIKWMTGPRKQLSSKEKESLKKTWNCNVYPMGKYKKRRVGGASICGSIPLRRRVTERLLLTSCLDWFNIKRSVLCFRQMNRLSPVFKLLDGFCYRGSSGAGIAGRISHQVDIATRQTAESGHRTRYRHLQIEAISSFTR